MTGNAMISSLPDWLDAMKLELAALGRLQPGWAGDRSSSVSVEARMGAYRLLRQLATKRTPRPALVPTADGSVQIEWHTAAVDLEIRVRSPAEICLSFEDHSSVHEPIEDEPQYDLRKLNSAVRMLSRS